MISLCSNEYVFFLPVSGTPIIDFEWIKANVGLVRTQLWLAGYTELFRFRDLIIQSGLLTILSPVRFGLLFNHHPEAGHFQVLLKSALKQAYWCQGRDFPFPFPFKVPDPTWKWLYPKTLRVESWHLHICWLGGVEFSGKGYPKGLGKQLWIHTAL